MDEITHLQKLLKNSYLTRFPIASLEMDFKQNYQKKITLPIKLTLFLGFIIFLTSSIFDLFFFYGIGSFTIRVIITSPILLFLLILSQLKYFNAYQESITAFFAVVMMLSLTYIAALVPDYMKDLHYQCLSLVLLVITSLAALQVRYIILLVVCMLIIFNVGIFYSNINFPIKFWWSFFGNNYILLAVGLLSIITAYFREINLRKQFLYEIILKKENEIIKNQSLQDKLTNVGNRRYYDEVLNKEWDRALRYRYPLSIIFVDLDYFKQFNDLYGHLAGDKALMAVADAISKAVKRSADFVARYGGDEFTIISANTDLDGAVSLAKNIKNNLKKMAIRHEGSKVSNFLSVTFGIASIVPSPGIDPVVLLNNADSALEFGKQKQRNHIYTYLEEKSTSILCEINIPED